MRNLMILAVVSATVFVACGKDHPTTPIPTGSCCVSAGTCTITTQANCTGAWTERGMCPPSRCFPYLPQSTPANALENLKVAYEERNLDQYKRLFSDDFAFVFSPVDARDPYNPTPAQWGKVEEFTSTSNMFTTDFVDEIDLDYLVGEPERADSVTYGPRAWKVKVENANLSVHTGNEAGERLIYMVPGTTEIFYLREEPSRPASDGRPTWFIFRWEDMPAGGDKTEVKSWGEVKYIYR